MKKIKVLCFLLAATSMPQVIFAGKGEAQTAQARDVTPTKLLPASTKEKARRVLDLLNKNIQKGPFDHSQARQALQAQRQKFETQLTQLKVALKKQEAAHKAQLETALEKQKRALQAQHVEDQDKALQQQQETINAQHAIELAQVLKEQEDSFAQTRLSLEQKIQTALKTEEDLSKELQTFEEEISFLQTSLQQAQTSLQQEKEARTLAETALEEKNAMLQAASEQQQQAVEAALTTLKTKITQLEEDLKVQKETIDHQNKALSWNLFVKDSIKLLHRNLSVSGHSFSPISEALLPYIEHIFSILFTPEEEIPQHAESKELKEARRSLNAALGSGDLEDLSQQPQKMRAIQEQILTYLAPPLVTQEAADPLLKHETAQAEAELEAVRALARKFNFEGSSKSKSTRSSQLSTPRKSDRSQSVEDDGNSNSIDSASSVKSRVTPKQTSPLSSHSSSAQSSQAARPSFLDQFNQIVAKGQEVEQAALSHPMHSQSEEDQDISPLQQRLKMPLKTPAKTQRTSEWVEQQNTLPLPLFIMEDSEEK